MIQRRRLDVVVVGGGPAGLAAADAAASRGRRVLLIDEGIRTGGQVWRHRPGDRLPHEATALLAAAAVPRIAVASRATVIDAESPTELVVSFRGRIAIVETASVILATGATELLLPFPGWTLPGVVGVGGLQALCKAGLPMAGMRVALLGSGPLLLPVAATLRKGGAEIVILGEQAPGDRVRRFAAQALADPRRLWQALRLRAATFGIGYHTDTWVVRATGNGRVEEVTWRRGGREESARCDWLATGAGLVPRSDLAELLGCDRSPDGAIRVDADQATSVPGVWAAGECCGIKGDAAGRVEGMIAGHAAAGGGAAPASLVRRREAGRRFGAALQEAFAPREELRARITDETILCRCEDVRWGELRHATSQRDAKLQTRLGMGSCQGAVCGTACAALLGWSRNAVRPPLGAPGLEGYAAALSRLRSPDPGAPPSPAPRGA